MYSEKTEIIDVLDISPVVLYEKVLTGTVSDSYKYFVLDDSAMALFDIAADGTGTIKDSTNYVLYLASVAKKWTDLLFKYDEDWGGFCAYINKILAPADYTKLEIRDARGYTLNKKAGDLYESALSGDVIRRHDISISGRVNFSYIGLAEVKKDDNGFMFKFANGDVFAASSADEYPSAQTMSDKQDEPLPILTYYSSTSSAGQLKIGSASGTNTTSADEQKIISALTNGTPVVVIINSTPHPVLGLKTATSGSTTTHSVSIDYNGSLSLRTIYTGNASA